MFQRLIFLLNWDKLVIVLRLAAISENSTFKQESCFCSGDLMISSSVSFLTSLFLTFLFLLRSAFILQQSMFKALKYRATEKPLFICGCLSNGPLRSDKHKPIRALQPWTSFQPLFHKNTQTQSCLEKEVMAWMRPRQKFERHVIVRRRLKSESGFCSSTSLYFWTSEVLQERKLGLLGLGLKQGDRV